MTTIAVIDYGMGNLHSAKSALEHVARRSGNEVTVKLTSDGDEIRAADRVMFPGVGAIRDCMAEIVRLGLDNVIREISDSKPILAVCIGLQALTDKSEENDGVECLGLLPGEVSFFGNGLFDGDTRLKVPHMGWNQVSQAISHPLWENIPDMSRFYFVHSYYVTLEDESMVAGQTNYGREFVSAASKENIFAVQFHPEKSSEPGLQLLENFLTWNP